MTVHLYVAPAAAGKSAYLIVEARRRSRDPASAPRVLVPTRLQARAWRRRLARAGGALGLQIGTFDDLYRDLLTASGEVVIRLTDPLEFRLLRTLVAEAPLTHYASLRHAPGFVQVVRELIAELKGGGVLPEAFTAAVQASGGERRLLELAQLYEAYQARLQQEGWADYAGVGWLAAEALEREPELGRAWSCLMVDGFDDLTTVQLRVLRLLAECAGELFVTLTGTAGGQPRDLVHRRFHRTQRRLEAALGVAAEPLPKPPPGLLRPAPALAHLEAALFAGESAVHPATEALTLVAAPNREGEVRAALRWLKARLVREGLGMEEVALLCRSVEPYRPYITQTAAEFGLPLDLRDGLPLQGNPAVAALLDLLRLTLAEEGAFPWRLTVGAWRSPYFDWEACTLPGDDDPIGITPEDALALDWVARWGSVIAGPEQWEAAFDLLVAAEPGVTRDEEAPQIPDQLPVGPAAALLRERFYRFVRRVTPPEGTASCRTFVGWLEGLIGEAQPPEEAPDRNDLGVVRRALEGPEPLPARDWAALNALKDVLRGLVWAEEAVGGPPLTFADFFDEVVGAVEATSYPLAAPSDRGAVLVATVAQARGLPFRAVAVLGLAEGEFPRAIAEDPFLRDADRARLRDDFGLALDLTTESAEAAYFYEAITRAREALLLTRPRIADNGARWQPSPFWEEVRRRVAVHPQRLTSRSRPAPEEAASWPDLLPGAVTAGEERLWAWVQAHHPGRCARIEAATAFLALRAGALPAAADHHDGNLSAWGSDFAARFGPQHVWSASRLERYRLCPYFFFVANLLGVEPRRLPTEGLDVRQLGNLYHRTLEALYRTVEGEEGIEIETLLRRLEEIAAPILESAPREEQFRPTAWWEQTRAEILEHLRRTVRALQEHAGDFRPDVQELAFGPYQAWPVLLVEEGEDAFRLRGFIDRVDRDPQGRLRIIDYKTGGPTSYTAKAVGEGKKLQLPLYALAAERALGAEVVEGFYWHVQHAEPSPLTLADFEDEGRRGPGAAVEVALAWVWEVVRGVRGGDFVPRVPDRGCPDYCPAAGFCWHYDPPAWRY